MRWIHWFRRTNGNWYKNIHDGSIDYFRARFCAKGYYHKARIDYQETFSPVVRYKSSSYSLALIAMKDLKVTQFNVKCAFLNGELEEEIFMVQPQGLTTIKLYVV